LVCGPTGSGKTTTLYTILKILNTRDKNITTVEDPVEYDIEGVNHVQVNVKAHLTFATGLRSILRQDPDIIMIGEIRDSETARIAINAAMTGHFVLSTLHTNDAVTSIPRLIDMGIERYLIASTLNVIVSQRLGRKLCTKCKEQTTITQEDYVQLQRVRPDLAQHLNVGETVYTPKGCAECEYQGFKGRIGVFEVLEITKNIKEEILKDSDAEALYNVAVQENFKLMVYDGIEKIKAGVVPISEIIRITALKE